MKSGHLGRRESLLVTIKYRPASQLRAILRWRELDSNSQGFMGTRMIRCALRKSRVSESRHLGVPVERPQTAAPRETPMLQASGANAEKCSIGTSKYRGAQDAPTPLFTAGAENQKAHFRIAALSANVPAIEHRAPRKLKISIPASNFSCDFLAPIYKGFP
jgi:hypothetical protein